MSILNDDLLSSTSILPPFRGILALPDLSQINGIDYQSQMVSLAAAMFSIALSTRASVDTRF
jgi:hypothetical protein